MARVEQIHISESGKHIKHPISKQIASMLLKIVDKEHFLTLWKSDITEVEIVRRLEITSNQMEFLKDYWEVPERAKRYGKVINNIDSISDRLWEDYAPRIQKMIQDALVGTLLSKG